MSGRTATDDDVIRKQQERDLGHALGERKQKLPRQPGEGSDRTPNPNQNGEDTLEHGAG